MIAGIWPQLAVAAVSGGIIGDLARPLWRRLRGAAQIIDNEANRMTSRIADLEELIDLLRKALDKHLIRESAVVTLSELLISMIEQMIDHADDPSLALLRTYERALELLKIARAQLDKINGGGAA